MKLSFEGCVFDSDTRQVSRDGEAIPLSPKAFALLEILIRDRPKAVTREEIHGHIWPATHVSEANLANLVMELRAALGDSARRPRIIRTVSRYGYSFCAEAVNAKSESRSTPLGAAYRLIWGRREIALNVGENLIGRDQEAVVWIDDESVSRRHARIHVGEGGVTLEDLGSKNGTSARGRRIREVVTLADKDELKIGPASMVFRILRRTGSTLSSIKDRAAR
jgi:DNA-binding winged helix-turn-helix (wHTH) protein